MSSDTVPFFFLAVETPLLPWLREYLADLLGLAGSACLIRGSALLHPALPWLVAGAILLLVARLKADLEQPPKKIPTGAPTP